MTVEMKQHPLTREGLHAYFDQMADENGRIDTTADWLTDVAMLIVHECETAMTRKHVYWAAGEPDCPRDIKAGNGELHTLRCKVCGLDSPRGFCRPTNPKQ